MIAYCRQCGSADLRPSHLRDGDLHYLFRLRYPIRCRTCRHRGSVHLLMILAVWYRARRLAMRSGHRHDWHTGDERYRQPGNK
jgi:ribosomal protein L40E